MPVPGPAAPRPAAWPPPALRHREAVVSGDSR